MGALFSCRRKEEVKDEVNYWQTPVIQSYYVEVPFDPGDLSPIRIPVTPDLCPEEGCFVLKCRGNCKVPLAPRA
jgi:hypothetical protein